MVWWQGPVQCVGIVAWWWGPVCCVGIAGGWQWWGLAFHIGVAPQWGLCMVGQCHGGPCVPCWDGVTAGLAHGKLALWVDLACSDRVAVVADLHMIKMEVARLVCSEAEAVVGTCEA